MRSPTVLPICLLLAVVTVREVSPFATNVPASSCETMGIVHRTNGGALIPARSGNPGFTFTHDMCRGYQAGQQYRVNIRAPANKPFQGFFCRLQSKNTVRRADAYGRFQLVHNPAYTTTSRCRYPGSSGVVHNRYSAEAQRQVFTSLSFVWKAPTEDKGILQITCSVAVTEQEFYVALRGGDIHFNPLDPTVRTEHCGVAASYPLARPLRTGPPSTPPAPVSVGPPSPPRTTCTQRCPAGQKGEQGIAGRVGPVGPRGITGPAGSLGPPGRTGIKGLKGDRGFGQKGQTGEDGARGYRGSTGQKGRRGDSGVQGLRGAKGSQGPPGRTVQSNGNGGQPGPTGQKGDKGSRGQMGALGRQGLPGPQGPTGRRGSTGPKGSKGDAGSNGRDGRQGIRGAQGLPGPTGPDGPAGRIGTPGPKGNQGRTPPGPNPAVLQAEVARLTQLAEALERSLAAGDVQEEIAAVRETAHSMQVKENDLRARVEVLERQLSLPAMEVPQCPQSTGCPGIPPVAVTPVQCHCEQALGIQNGTIANDQMMSSPTRTPLYGADRARLHGSHAWVAKGTKNEYLEIDFRQVVYITGVITQGLPQSDHFVRDYSLSSYSGGSWQPVMDGAKLKVCDGNVDAETPAMCLLECALRGRLATRKLRIQPRRYSGSVALRVEVIGCPVVA